MKIARQLTIGAIICCTAFAVFFIVSCSSTSNPTATGGQTYAPPTALRALSGDDTLYIVWHASTAKDSSAFAGYSIVATDLSGNSVTITDPNKNDTSVTMSSLTNGTVYTITIRSLATDGTQGPASESLKWAPAKRTYGIELYSLQASAGCPSGLELSATNGVQAVSVSQNPDLVDLVFDDRGSAFDIESANLKGTGIQLPRKTNIATYTGTANGLSDLVLADSSVDTTGWVPEVAGLGDNETGKTANGKGVTYYVKTQDGNFARIFVHADANGNLISTDMTGDACNNYTYITVDVSFQTAAGMVYSIAHAAGKNVQKSN
jgi:hypothetical protein